MDALPSDYPGNLDIPTGGDLILLLVMLWHASALVAKRICRWEMVPAVVVYWVVVSVHPLLPRTQFQHFFHHKRRRERTSMTLMLILVESMKMRTNHSFAVGLLYRYCSQRIQTAVKSHLTYVRP